ncbi:hypothetical protein SCHPADRAFT_908567 [Schizopora paradoxa]|uniref:DUF6699 domain-containing protein n=1 Tax=Schizopora paradoxa TaxID=27342 RepID=A0A0H2R9H6_9AGAM|nr:hypothetical protein SCHPADRAFT_908567 [Schizopora paradoxa]
MPYGQIPVMPVATPAAVNYGLPPPPAPVAAATPAAPAYLLPTPGHYEWVPHPFPHPTIPAQQFFQQVPFVPVTWTPGQLQLVTGGLPAPGTAPAWNADAYSPAPAQTQAGFALSPWLAPNPRNANIPHVLWDTATEWPSQMRRLTVRGLVVDFAGTPQFADALAVTPAQQRVVLSVSPACNALWGPVSVEQSREGGVRVADVYWALHRYLHTQVMESDLARIYSMDRGRERYRRMEYACWRRCMDAQAIPGALAAEGMKRVDFLEGSTIFWGMWCRRDDNGNIYLCVGFCPP